MDRALKERIVGATVLVVFIVLVVPVFLDGPAEDPGMVSESVTLPGQNGQERKRQTIVLERDRKEPVPVAGPPASANEPEAQANDADAASDNTPRPLTAEPVVERAASPADDEPDMAAQDAEQDAARDEAEAAETPAVADEPAPPPEPETREAPAAAQSTTGMWAVQLGSFSNKTNAERLASELRGKGYAAFLSQLSRNGRQLHRVRIGPQKDRASAESVAGKLSSDGHKGQVVPHP